MSMLTPRTPNFTTSHHLEHFTPSQLVSDRKLEHPYSRPFVFQMGWEEFTASLRESIMPDRTLEANAASSESPTVSDFEFGARVADAADPPESPKFFDPVFRRDVSSLCPVPLPSAPSFSVRQLLAAELREPRARKEDKQKGGSRALGWLLGSLAETKCPKTSSDTGCLAQGSQITLRLHDDRHSSCREISPATCEKQQKVDLIQKRKKKWALIKAFLFDSQRSGGNFCNTQHTKSRQ